jgi:hypothetical protein
MGVQSRKLSRRWEQSVLRNVFGLGTLILCLLTYRLSDASTAENLVLPAIVLGVAAISAAFSQRARRRQAWFEAWETYAKRELRHQAEETVSAMAAH